MTKRFSRIALTLVTGFAATNTLSALCMPVMMNQKQVLLAWRKSNFSMTTVPADYNRYHHIVGTAGNKFLGSRPIPVGGSFYMNLNAGPYGASTSAEIQFNSDENRTVKRFRFLSRDKVGNYTSWLTEDFGPPHNVYFEKEFATQLCITSETFDRSQWQTDVGGRWLQTWDLLHSHAIVGLTRTQIESLLGAATHTDWQADVTYYQLQTPTDDTGHPLPYLELKWAKGRVVAFQIEQGARWNWFGSN